MVFINTKLDKPLIITFKENLYVHDSIVAITINTNLFIIIIIIIIKFHYFQYFNFVS